MDDKVTGVFIIIVAIVGLVGGALVGVRNMREEAVKAGVAYWHPATGAFTYIKVERKPEIKE